MKLVRFLRIFVMSTLAILISARRSFSKDNYQYVQKDSCQECENNSIFCRDSNGVTYCKKCKGDSSKSFCPDNYTLIKYKTDTGRCLSSDAKIGHIHPDILKKIRSRHNSK